MRNAKEQERLSLLERTAFSHGKNGSNLDFERLKVSIDFYNVFIMDLKEYISTVSQKYRAGNATEHTYRGGLEQLMQALLPKLRIVN